MKNNEEFIEVVKDFVLYHLYLCEDGSHFAEISRWYKNRPKECALLESICIPETIIHEGIDYPVEILGDLAFQGYSKLQEVSLPKTLKSMNVASFAGCGLSVLRINSNIVFYGLWINNANWPLSDLYVSDEKVIPNLALLFNYLKVEARDGHTIDPVKICVHLPKKVDLSDEYAEKFCKRWNTVLDVI